MLQVIDTSEASHVERWQHDAEKTAPLPGITQPAQRRIGLLGVLHAAVVSLSKRTTRPQPWVKYPQQRFELPIDRIAREQPYILIKAMAG